MFKRKLKRLLFSDNEDYYPVCFDSYIKLIIIAPNKSFLGVFFDVITKIPKTFIPKTF